MWLVAEQKLVIDDAVTSEAYKPPILVCIKLLTAGLTIHNSSLYFLFAGMD